eukprot:UN24707
MGAIVPDKGVVFALTGTIGSKPNQPIVAIREDKEALVIGCNVYAYDGGAVYKKSYNLLVKCIEIAVEGITKNSADFFAEEMNKFQAFKKKQDFSSCVAVVKNINKCVQKNKSKAKGRLERIEETIKR